MNELMAKLHGKQITDVEWGLFEDPEAQAEDVRTYENRIAFLKEHGFAEPAYWSTDAWFIAAFKDILGHYRHHRKGTPIVIDDFDYDNEGESLARNEKAFDAALDEMLGLLGKMDEDYWLAVMDSSAMGFEEANAAMEGAKDRFFELFSKYFYSLWD